MIYGYARVSSETQSYDGQLEALTAAGCEKIFAEKYTGKAASDRKQLQALLGKVRMLGDGETQRAVARLLDVGQATIARLAARA
jgi:DNA invertase Pin-like site-specific DNA recombinase